MEVLNSFTWNWNEVTADFLRITISFILTLPVAWQRYTDPGRNTGFRTFPIVAVASCGYLSYINTSCIKVTRKPSRHRAEP
jgi:hypothetical protein